jgi:preprotein translocase subunit SecE
MIKYKTVNRLIKFVSETREELSKVKWPKRDDVIRLTVVVFIISAAVGIYLGGLDYIFTKALGIIFNK